MNPAAALSWFARHELRLALREWLALMAGRRGRKRAAVIGLIGFGSFRDAEISVGTFQQGRTFQVEHVV